MIEPRVPNHIGAARYIAPGNVEDDITATPGGGQPDAYVLRAQVSVVTVCASGGDSVQLPKTIREQARLGSLNSMVIVSNQSSESVQVFGGSPDTIDGSPTGTGVVLRAGQTATFFVTSYDASTDVGEWVSTIPMSGSGTMAVGDPVLGSIPNAVFFADAGLNLAQDASFGFDGYGVFANALTVVDLVAAESAVLDPSVYARQRGATGFAYNKAYTDNGESAAQVVEVNGDVFASFSDALAAHVYCFGIDVSDGGALVLSVGIAPGTANVFRADGTTFEVVDELQVTPLAGTAGAIAFVDVNGKLEVDSGFTFDATQGELTVDTTALNGTRILSKNLSASGPAYFEARSANDDAFILFHDNVTTAYSIGFDTDNNKDFVIAATSGPGMGSVILSADHATQNVTMPSLAGIGTRTVVVDANGKLSAP